MQNLLVYQSLVAMERRLPGEQEWSLQERLEMIRDAGFDGVGLRFDGGMLPFEQGNFVKTSVDFLQANGMSWEAQSYARSVEDFKSMLDRFGALGADHINLQPDVRPASLDECVRLLEGWQRLADDAGIALHVETHRNRMTNDLLFMLEILDRLPELKITGDLSHYVVGREITLPVTDENEARMRRIIDRCWGFHGRVSSAEQIQIPLFLPHNAAWLDQFTSWWEYGFRSFRARAPQYATLTFLCELGPRPYAITDASDIELSDRWEEAQKLMRLVRDIWQRLEAGS